MNAGFGGIRGRNRRIGTSCRQERHSCLDAGHQSHACQSCRAL